MLGSRLSRCSRRTSRSSSAARVSGADTPLGLKRRGNRFDRLLDVVVADSEMGDGAQVTGAEIAEQHALWAEPLERAGGLGDRDEVRLDRGRVDRYARICETLGEAARARVILGQPV